MASQEYGSSPHHCLHETGARISDASDILRPGLRQGCTFMATQESETLQDHLQEGGASTESGSEPHNDLHEAGENNLGASDSWRPGLSQGGSFVPSKESEQSQSYLEESGGIIIDERGIVRLGVQQGSARIEPKDLDNIGRPVSRQEEMAEGKLLAITDGQRQDEGRDETLLSSNRPRLQHDLPEAVRSRCGARPGLKCGGAEQGSTVAISKGPAELLEYLREAGSVVVSFGEGPGLKQGSMHSIGKKSAGGNILSATDVFLRVCGKTGNDIHRFKALAKIFA